jgi:chemotaxis protein CheD
VSVFDAELASQSAPLPIPAEAHELAYLHPGQLLATAKPTEIKTILGSCIAVCLWDGERGIGGMNHYLLPQGAPSSPNPGRFGSSAIPRLIAAMLEQGARATKLQAKVFGGASMIAGVEPRATNVGLQNTRLASELLARAGIPVISSDVGGARGRKIVFRTDAGSVALWTL